RWGNRCGSCSWLCKAEDRPSWHEAAMNRSLTNWSARAGVPHRPGEAAPRRGLNGCAALTRRRSSRDRGWGGGRQADLQGASIERAARACGLQQQQLAAGRQLARAPSGWPSAGWSHKKNQRVGRVSTNPRSRIRKGDKINEIGPGTVFGELAILYNCKRGPPLSESVQIQGDSWRGPLAKLADVLEADHFGCGYGRREYRHQTGRQGNTFYIIAKANVRVTKKDSTSGDTVLTVRNMGKGDATTAAAIALKQMKKQPHSGDAAAGSHIMNDRKYLYMLMEYLLGGEAVDCAQRQRQLSMIAQPDSTSAAVVEKRCHYLAPQRRGLSRLENPRIFCCGLSAATAKLTDFGFPLKQMRFERMKTWTFCG
uniref:Cyclic nucleotide-binding domain-containing protein n=1 Tax=Macrostomum lignano TaxID=282301 RepID=A0A1I8F9N3_9PLAT